MTSVLLKSKLFAGWRRESPLVWRVMGGVTIRKAYDRICLEDFRQTCFGRVVGVWGRRGSIAFLIFYGSKFNVGWFGCHPGCNELRKYNRVLQLSKMSKNCINAFKKQNSDNTYVVQGGNFSLTNSRTEEPCALFITFYLINRGKKSLRSRTLLEYRLTFQVSFKRGSFVFMPGFICFMRCYDILSSIVKKWLISTA